MAGHLRCDRRRLRARERCSLAQHDPSLVEDWRGPDSWRPGPREPVSSAAGRHRRAASDTCAHRASDSPQAEEPARLPVPGGATASAALRGRSGSSGESPSIDEQAREEFGIELPPFDRRDRRVHGALQSRCCLGNGPLADRVYDAARAPRSCRQDRRNAMCAGGTRRAWTRPRRRSTACRTKAIELVFPQGSRRGTASPATRATSDTAI